MKKTRYFQWIAGDDIGNVVILNNITEYDGGIYYNFNDGESCNIEFISKMTNTVADLKGKLMVEIDSISNPWTIDVVQPKKYTEGEESYEIPTLHDVLLAQGHESQIDKSDVGRQKLSPPKNNNYEIIDLPKIEDYKVVLKTPVQQTRGEIETQIEIKQEIKQESKQIEPNKASKQSENKLVDPVRIIVETCKKHSTDIEFTLNMNLPSRSMYMIAESEFDDGGNKFIDCVVEDMDVSEIINQLKVTLKTEYSQKRED